MRGLKTFLLKNKKESILLIIANCVWLWLLKNTESYYVNFVLISIVSVVLLLTCYKQKTNKRDNTITIIFSLFFSIAILITNYEVFDNYNPIYVCLYIILITISGFLIFRYLLLSLQNLINTKTKSSTKEINYKKVFLYTFILITCVHGFILMSSFLPGIITNDSLNQLEQIETGIYSNHHPIIHTLFIKVYYDFGKSITGDVNIGIICYCIFQIITMALIESFANATLSRLKIKPITLILFALSFAILPYNFMYSFSLWKDILFGGFILLFITCLIRIKSNIGNKHINNLLFIISALLICLFRNNGLYALLAFSPIYALNNPKDIKRIITIFFVSFIAYFLSHNLLQVFGIQETEGLESLAIPIQQISRAVIENNITNNESSLISKLIDIEKIKNLYNPHIVDDIKNYIYDNGDIKYFNSNIIEYIKLYFSMLIKYPKSFIYAWVDQTKGYLNSGYDYWIWRIEIANNNVGICRNVILQPIASTIERYLCLFNNLSILKPFISIGLNVQTMLIVLYIGIINKNKNIITVCSLPLAVIATLLIATPVFSEFRYAYCIFTTLFMICAYSKTQIINNNNIINTKGLDYEK